MVKFVLVKRGPGLGVQLHKKSVIIKIPECPVSQGAKEEKPKCEVATGGWGGMAVLG